jgi:hypothetical protein
MGDRYRSHGNYRRSKWTPGDHGEQAEIQENISLASSGQMNEPLTP